ncbi:MAG: hypothetical protein E7240_08955 [Lachnospiraceae bacterium]|nr:hypothetical protein [Lachnospiraceae bacterium]
MSHMINYGFFGVPAARWINQQTTAGIIFIVASIIIVFILYALWAPGTKAIALLITLAYGVLFGLKTGACLLVFSWIIGLLVSLFKKKETAEKIRSSGSGSSHGSGSNSGSHSAKLPKLFASEEYSLLKMDQRALEVMDPWLYQQFLNEKEAVMTHNDFTDFCLKWDPIIEDRTQQKIRSML